MLHWRAFLIVTSLLQSVRDSELGTMYPNIFMYVKDTKLSHGIFLTTVTIVNNESVNYPCHLSDTIPRTEVMHIFSVQRCMLVKRFVDFR